ncbi:hypothetical protein CDAR_232401 [Caerostris darwini]|uniref:Uncharacterized protein n=1 Tax=Caerostris darwini TaxID=1538125 RepID=A0AAV4W5K8_9ARAC|nr:hypothetical protein CDAR_232401 [Caerostris darwini]
MKLLTSNTLPTKTKPSVNKAAAATAKHQRAQYTATEIITQLPEDTKLPPGEVEHQFLPLNLPNPLQPPHPLIVIIDPPFQNNRNCRLHHHCFGTTTDYATPGTTA